MCDALTTNRNSAWAIQRQSQRVTTHIRKIARGIWTPVLKRSSLQRRRPRQDQHSSRISGKSEEICTQWSLSCHCASTGSPKECWGQIRWNKRNELWRSGFQGHILLNLHVGPKKQQHCTLILKYWLCCVCKHVSHDLNLKRIHITYLHACSVLHCMDGRVKFQTSA